MKKTPLLMLALVFLLTLCQCTGPVAEETAQTSASVPELHPMVYDDALDTLDDDEGADAFAHALDHPDSKYYVFQDYYNMESGGGLHLLPHFQTYQQTTEYSCGCAAAVMVLNYFGRHDYNETEICDLAGTDTETGTTVEGLADFFASMGWETDFHADTDYRFETIDQGEAFFLSQLDAGIPVMVDWCDWAGHWQVLIGLDTCGTDSPYDDVMIMADPYDVTDHYQDGYYTVPFGRFFESMWREGPCAGKTDPYVQPFVAAFPAE